MKASGFRQRQQHRSCATDICVHFGTGAGIVDTMDKALAMRVSELRDVTILSTVGIHEEPRATYRAAAALGEEGPKHVRFTSAHFSAFDRRMATKATAGTCR